MSNNISTPGFLALRGSSFFVPFSKATDSTSPDNNPGTLEFSSGFDPALPDIIQRHLDHDCADAASTPTPTEIRFPILTPLWLQHQPVQVLLPPFKNTHQEWAATSWSHPCSYESYDQLRSHLNGSGRNTPEVQALLDIIAEGARTFLNDIVSMAADRQATVHPMTVVTALRLKDGGHCHWSHPHTFNPNEHNWKAFIKGLSWTDGLLTVQLASPLTPYRLGIRQPVNTINRRFYALLNSGSLAGAVEGVDFFIAPSRYPEPDSETIYTSRYTTSDAIFPWIGPTGDLQSSARDPKSVFGFGLGNAHADICNNALFAPDHYTWAAFQPLDSISKQGKWLEVPMDLIAVAQSKTHVSPDYTADRSGRGDLMLTSHATHVVANPAFHVSSPTATYDSDTELANPEVTEWATLPMANESCAVYVSFQEKEGVKWYRVAHGLRWVPGADPLWIFHPDTSSISVAEECPVDPADPDKGKHHRVFDLTRIPDGSRWERRTQGMPPWTAGEFTPDGVELLVDLEECPLLLPDPHRLLCGPAQIPGWYPTMAKGELEYMEDLHMAVIHELHSSADSAPNLCVFSNHGLLNMAHKSIIHDGRELHYWYQAGPLGEFNVSDPISTFNTGSMVVFLASRSVMAVDKKGCRTLGNYQEGFPPGSTLFFHPEICMLEVRGPSGTPLWCYDCTSSKEIPLEAEEDLPATLEELGMVKSDNRCLMLTGIFRIMQTGPAGALCANGKEAVPLRLFLTGASWSGNPRHITPYEQENLKTVLSLSTDLSHWIHIPAQGAEINSILPVASRARSGLPIWYRLAAMTPREWGEPLGMFITCR